MQRQKISRGLRRYWRAVKAKKAARSRAARKGWITRRAVPTLERLEKKKKIVPAAIVETPEREEWEVTFVSPMGKEGYETEAGDVVDITFRLTGKPGAKYTDDQVRAALWFAHKHGAHALGDFTLDGMDWRNEHKGGGEKDYPYPNPKVSLQEALDNAGGILNTVGLAGLRVALVE